MEFKEFTKIARLSRDCVVTEKIDGTNGQIFICTMDEVKTSFAGDYQNAEIYANEFVQKYSVAINGGLLMFAGSRNRWLSDHEDNYGFWHWVKANNEELFKLGTGRHFGEWWGSGVQRGYGLVKGEKRFSLFNTYRWAAPGTELKQYPTQDPRIMKSQEHVPTCCHVVPVLYEGIFDTAFIEGTVTMLKAAGSKAAPGFMNPEGVVIFHIAGSHMYKKTIEKDNQPKSLAT